MVASGPRSEHNLRTIITSDMKNAIVTSFVGALLLTIGLTGCEKNSGEAVVLAKEHIDTALLTAETPTAQSASSPDEQLRPMADDEIAVDGYVMKSEARDTSRDPRALKHEQCIVKVRLVDNGRTI